MKSSEECRASSASRTTLLPNHLQPSKRSKMPILFSNRNALSWFLMVSAVALHVVDEALTGFLPFYNQLMKELGEEIGFFPMPSFSLGSWLTGLIIAIMIGYSLIPFVIRGGRFIRVFTTVLGLLMIVNALGHFFGSIYFGKILPGMWSSPFLLLAAFYVVIRGFRGEWPIKEYNR